MKWQRHNLYIDVKIPILALAADMGFFIQYMYFLALLERFKTECLGEAFGLLSIKYVTNKRKEMVNN